MKKLFFLLFVILSSLLATPHIVVELDVNGTIGPASSSYLKNGIQMATKQNAQMLIVKLDTTSGLFTSMEEMIQDIANAPIPAVMYVRPKDSQITNTSAYLMLISNMGVIDLSTNNTQELLSKLDGKQVKIAGKHIILNTKNATLVKYNTDFKTEFLYTITNPNIIYILFLVMIYGLFFELINPGGVFPGVIGLISGIIVLYALNLIPFNYAGLLLIALGIGFMITEIFVAGFGILGIGGAISFAIGSFLLFDANTLGSSVSISLIIAFTIVTIGFFILVIKMLLRTRSVKIVTGIEDIIGSKGQVIDANGQSYHVWCQGESWSAVSQTQLKPKQEIEVVGLNGLTLDVKPIKE